MIKFLQQASGRKWNVLFIYLFYIHLSIYLFTLFIHLVISRMNRFLYRISEEWFSRMDSQLKELFCEFHRFPPCRKIFFSKPLNFIYLFWLLFSSQLAASRVSTSLICSEYLPHFRILSGRSFKGVLMTM